MATQPLVKAVVLIKRRQTRKERTRKAFSHRVQIAGALVLAVLSVAMAVAALAALPLFLSVTQNLPSVARLPELLDPAMGALLQPTQLMDRTGQTILLRLEPATAPRAFVDAVANPLLAAAFIASQEPDYWAADHSTGLAASPQGIAEKLMARLLLAGEPDGWPKTVRARLLAAEAIKTYGRGLILNWALNSAYFGHWAFGIESASQLYFGKPAASLSLPEAALLAAVAQAPALNPFDAPELSVAYQHLVLGALRDQGFISQIEFENALAAPLVFASPPSPTRDASTIAALSELEGTLSADRVRLGNLTAVTSIDSDLQRELNELTRGSTLQAMVLDPLNGHVLALSVDALTSRHTINNILLPLEYLEAFAEGKSPASLVWLDGNPTNLRAALAHGEAFQADAQLDPKAAEIFGFVSADGELTGTLLDVASAYGSLVNGYLAGHASGEPSSLLFASDAQGQVLLNNAAPALEAIVNPELAYLVTDVLADVSVRDEAAGLPTGRPYAYFASGQWAVGYSPQRVIAIWSEGDEDLVPIWSALFEAAHRGLPAKNWDVPANLSSLVVCVPSGLLPEDDCPETRREWFLVGTEPTQSDNLFQRIAINTLNGDLATVFTPQEFVEERVFVVAPAGRRTTLEQPPEEYDPIPAFAGQSNPVTIASPALFAQIRGEVHISAILNAEATEYDVQVGQGLWPTEWSLVTEGQAPFNRRISVEWDATGLSGIWSIQVQTWDGDGILSRTYSVVTVSH